MDTRSITATVTSVLAEVLSLDRDHHELQPDTMLLGNIPEFDSMAIVSVITALEEEFELEIPDEELSAEAFESVASLSEFMQQQLESQ